MSFWYIASFLMVDFGVYAMLDWYSHRFNLLVAFVHVNISTYVILIHIDSIYTAMV